VRGINNNNGGKIMKTAEKVIEMAGVTLVQIMTDAHMGNYHHLMVMVIDGDIYEAGYDETIDKMIYESERVSVLTVGTGSCPCNCDACQNDEDPREWVADDGDAMQATLNEIQAALDGLAVQS